jgi:hypothetical protein
MKKSTIIGTALCVGYLAAAVPQTRAPWGEVQQSEALKCAWVISSSL